MVALSGGADSVALLRVLLDAGTDCVAAHCNFHLRGEESDRDEQFVRTLCERLHTPLHVVHFRTKEHAESKGISVEMAARELRYGWFEEIREQTGAKVTAVAHHRDDSVETFLLNLTRGTGINGLKGIRPVNGRVVRPLLCVGRKEILDYLQALGQDYVTDSTNLTDDFTRNKIRLDIIPSMAEINPSVSESIAETARRLADVSVIYAEAVQAACRRVTLPDGSIAADTLMRETAPRAILFELLHPLGFNAAQQADIYRCMENGVSGRKFLADGNVLLLDHGRLTIGQERGQEHPSPTPRLHTERIPFAAGRDTIPKDPHVACVDADKVAMPLVLRTWQPGDKFVPFGMRGYKKVRDYLRDHKCSLTEKERQLVACDASGNIVWLVNERTDNRFRVGDSTREILRIQLE